MFSRFLQDRHVTEANEKKSLTSFSVSPKQYLGQYLPVRPEGDQYRQEPRINRHVDSAGLWKPSRWDQVLWT